MKKYKIRLPCTVLSIAKILTAISSKMGPENQCTLKINDLLKYSVEWDFVDWIQRGSGPSCD